MIKLELKIQNKGELVGTSGWLKNHFFKDSHIAILKMAGTGLPGLFLVGKNKYDEETKDLICFVSNQHEDGYQSYGRIKAVYPQANYNIAGILNSLTDASYKILDEFIYDCVKILLEFWESDEADFKINIEKINSL